LYSYVRLELLEGISAFYGGELREARDRLLSARAKWQRLQVSDEALAALSAMGFPTAEASGAHHGSVDPMRGCPIGTKCHILHDK
jgi:hypothetical protein